ncbi:MAG TPA: recombinase family protein [Anaerolineae bacterium]|nr:recombinase family protein [Anaerolineae bacterium]
MRCIIWAAVSSKPQASEEKDSIPSQLDSARELVARNEGWHEVHEPLVVGGHSRSYIFLADAAAEMPVYTEVMSLARSGSIDLLICRGRDRLGRTDALIAQVEEYLASYNVQVHSLTMPTRILDPEEFAQHTDRASIWMRSVERAKAQDETAEIRARHRTGMRRRARDGYHANMIPYGYRLGAEGICQIYEPEAPVVRQMFDWLLDGVPISHIQEQVPTVASGRYPRSFYGIKYILRNPFYMGTIGYHRIDESGHRFRDRSEWITGAGLHQALISEETWEAAQLELDARENGHAPLRRYPLSGSIYCGYCGQRMSATVTSSGEHVYRYFICRTPRSECDRPTRRNTIRMDLLDQAVLQWLYDRATRPDLLANDMAAMMGDQLQADEEREAELERARQSKRAALDRWARDYEDGLLGRYEYYEHRRRLEDDIEVLDASLQQIQERRPRLDPDVLSVTLETGMAPGLDYLRAHWHDPEVARRVKVLLRRIGLRVEVRQGSQSIALSH